MAPLLGFLLGTITGAVIRYLPAFLGETKELGPCKQFTRRWFWDYWAEALIATAAVFLGPFADLFLLVISLLTFSPPAAFGLTVDVELQTAADQTGKRLCSKPKLKLRGGG